MTKCPKCGKWTLDFDDYFGRFRCFDEACGWMAASSTERQLRILEKQTEPQLLCAERIGDTGLQLTASYDGINDALQFDFGTEEPAFDLPEQDGRLVWRVGMETSSVCGFAILDARTLGVTEVQVEMVARCAGLEQRLRALPDIVRSGRASRILIEKVFVRAKMEEAPQSTLNQEVSRIFRQAVAGFQKKLPQACNFKQEQAEVGPM